MLYLNQKEIVSVSGGSAIVIIGALAGGAAIATGVIYCKEIWNAATSFFSDTREKLSSDANFIRSCNVLSTEHKELKKKDSAKLDVINCVEKCLGSYSKK